MSLSTKAKPGDYLKHITGIPVVVDTSELYNDNPSTLRVRYCDDVGVVEVSPRDCFPACIRCHGEGKLDLGGLEVDCEDCGGTGLS